MKTKTKPTKLKSKYSERVQALLHHHNIDPVARVALVELIAFADRRPNLDSADYGNNRAALNADMRKVNTDWNRFQSNLQTFMHEKITDEQLLAGTKDSRLEWDQEQKLWGYCAGQNYPTEYRAACARLLSNVIHEVKQSRPRVFALATSIDELKDQHEIMGSYWFDKDTMDFFKTKIESDVIDGHYFVTSEQPPHGSRGFTLRSFDEKGKIRTMGQCAGFHTYQDAVDSIPRQDAEAEAQA